MLLARFLRRMSSSLPRPRHVIWETEELVAYLHPQPWTPGTTILEPKTPDEEPSTAQGSLFRLGEGAYLRLLLGAREVGALLCERLGVKRCALVCRPHPDSNSPPQIRVLPLHGLDSEWRPHLAGDEHYTHHDPGYVTSKSGPRWTDTSLQEIQAEIQAQLPSPNALPNLTFLGEDPSHPGLFSRIVRGEEQQWRVWEDEGHVAFLTPFPNAPGITVLVPRRPLTSDIFRLEEADYTSLVLATQKVARVLEEGLGAWGVGLIFEGFEIDYAHAKLIPLLSPPSSHQVDRGHFPCSRWLRSVDGDVELRNGDMCLLNSETVQTLKDHRLKDLHTKQQHIRWRTFAEGVPHCVDMTSLKELGPNLSYTRQSPGINLQYLRGFAERAESWSSFTELETMFSHNGSQNTVAKYVQAHWAEDWFFGYQCLNGCNPLMVRQTRLLPPNLSINSDILCPFLPDGSSLEQELERGSIFLLDYEMLEGVPANVINGKQQFLAAPLVLLHLNQQGELKPIAIQLQQAPGPQNPVFLPSDPGPDWLLAKTWVRCSDFQCHQLSSHFLRTHLLGEVCCTATLRQLPEVHPLHQLLMPHIKTTLQINIQARASLLAANGVFDKNVGCGLEALPVLLSRATERLRYRSLCVPDDLADRGIHTLKHCYYAHDALRVWNALHRFVSGWVDMYYLGDQDVEQDSELQSWITEIYTHGFLQLPHSGCPQSFQTKPELSQFVTMVIYCCSALHAAVNFSQVDFDLWMPNCPASMMHPPPQTKGMLTEDEILSILPDVNSTCNLLITLFLLSQPAADYVPLCQYREPVFSSGAPHRLVEKVQAELRAISDEITDRNKKLELPYDYMSPDRIENSVAI